MFEKQFYPTPRHVIDRMGIDCAGKVCLEPSAGKGDIVDYMKLYGAKEVLACEKNKDLWVIVSKKAVMLGRDFFDVASEDISHVNLIVMNPPFFYADKHILHAWEIAPEGCEIISLCNFNMIKRNSGSSLSTLIKDYGNSENLGDCFSNAERKTDVEVGLIHLFKPILSEKFDFDGFFFEEEIDSEVGGIMPYNEIRAIVNSYVGAVKLFDKFRMVADEMEQYTKITDFGKGFSFDVSYGSENKVTTKDSFAKAMQKHCWKFVFNKMGIEKYVTRGVMENINRFVEQQQAYPFTMRNVYRMLEIIIGTREDTMNKTIVEAVDNFTKYTKENRYGVEGWKTNSGYMLNEKFICNDICYQSFSGKGLKFNYGGQADRIVDLQKALCFITGENFDEIKKMYDWKEMDRGVWYDWGFFEFKLYLKGSGHFKFKKRRVWEKLNRAYAKAKGQVLPEKM